jgi:hypothetical protein
LLPNQFCAGVPAQIQNQSFGLGKSIFYLVGVLFPDHWDSVFYYLVGNLLDVVVSVRPGFYFVGVVGGLVSG